MCDELPEPIEVRHGNRSYPVEPLVLLELVDPRAAELLRRHRHRHRLRLEADEPAGR